LSSELPDDLTDIRELFRLPSDELIVKDFYVTRALAAIARADAAPFKAVFAGGTALSRAHRLVRRMSEDIDIRLVAEGEPARSVIRTARKSITKALLDAAFEFDPANPEHRHSRAESRYTLFRLPYPTRGDIGGGLRPSVQVELLVAPARTEPVLRPVSSFVAEALKAPPEIESVACISVLETAADKLVALTRRAAIELAGEEGEADPTLVRHIYDLHAIRPHVDAKAVSELARIVATADAIQFAGQHAAYRDDPLGISARALAALAGHEAYAARYRAFVDEMVYGEIVDYNTALEAVRELARQGFLR
jgi:hypothetical protein